MILKDHSCDTKEWNNNAENLALTSQLSKVFGSFVNDTCCNNNLQRLCLKSSNLYLGSISAMPRHVVYVGDLVAMF